MFEIQRDKSICSVGLFTNSCLSFCKLGSLRRRTIQGLNLFFIYNLLYITYYKSVSIQFKSDKIPLHLCTHIFYAFAVVNLTTFETRWGICNLPWSNIYCLFQSIRCKFRYRLGKYRRCEWIEGETTKTEDNSLLWWIFCLSTWNFLCQFHLSSPQMTIPFLETRSGPWKSSEICEISVESR